MNGTASHQKEREMITQLHIDNGRMMRRIVREDVLRGQSVEDAVESLATYLEIDVDAVKLALAIANEADSKSLDEINRLGL